VNLRYLVPVLGIIAVSIPVASAADQASPAPVLTFNGWVDTILNVSSANKPDDNASTSKDDKALEVGFQNEASLKANIKISDSVTGKINLFISPGNNSDVNMREAYVDWAMNQELYLQVGKSIDTIGWLSPEPTGLYTVNASLIGYTGIYGNDVIGAGLGFSQKGCPLTGSVHVTNGYFTAADAHSVTPMSATGAGSGKTTTRGNSDLGYCLDLTYNLPGDGNFINLDFAYDPHGAFFQNFQVAGALAPITGDEGGNAMLIGVNGQYNITKGFLVAAEIMEFTVGNDKALGATEDNTGGARTQGLVLANYVIPKTSFPVSVTGEIQYITDKQKGAGSKEKASEETLAILTNPTNSTFFGLNAELSFTQYTSPVSGASKVNAITFSVEALLSF
jgi:hypothetical protein